MGEVYVTIRYDRDGTPAADPPEVRVKAGTRITWRNEGQDDPGFVLDFDDRVPEPGAPRRRVESRKAHGVFEASIVATPTPPGAQRPGGRAPPASERYAYEVAAGGRSADPAIIIDR